MNAFSLVSIVLLCPGIIFSDGHAISVSSSPKCEEIRIGLCKSLPYNRTQLPNTFEQASQWIINRTLLDLAQRHNSGICSEDLLFFVCSLYLPICVENNRIPKPIKPCRSVCEKVKRDCQAAIDDVTGEESHLLRHLPELECDKLKTYDQGVCVTPHAFNHSPAKPNSTRIAANKQGFIKKQDFLNANFDFAIKGKILSIIQVLAPKGYSIQFNVSRVIVKDGFLFRGSVVQIWSQYNYTRFTHSFSTLLEMGRRYVFLGHGNRTKGFTIGWAWAWPRDKHLVDKLRKWKTQSRKRNSVD